MTVFLKKSEYLIALPNLVEMLKLNQYKKINHQLSELVHVSIVLDKIEMSYNRF